MSDVEWTLYTGSPWWDARHWTWVPTFERSDKASFCHFLFLCIKRQEV